MTELSTLTVCELSSLLACRKISSVEVTKSCTDRIERLDPILSTVVRLTEERAFAEARVADEEIAAGQNRGPLHGIPYGVKDIIDVEGIVTGAQSRLTSARPAGGDADVVARLKAAGAVLLAKLNTHEFAVGGPSFDLPNAPARNPWGLDHWTGGSSSGSAAAVASGLLPLAIGTDTGGSIRVPAAFCGLAGLKPQTGRVGCGGVLPLSSTMDTVGPLAWTAVDCAMAFDAMASAGRSGAAQSAVEGGVKGLRLGVLREFPTGAGLAETWAAIDDAVDLWRVLGMEIYDCDLPEFDYFAAACWAIHFAESYVVHEHNLRTRPQDYARITFERLSLGAFVTSADYVRAQDLRTQLTQQMDALFDQVDILVGLTVPGAAPLMSNVEDGPWRKQTPFTVPPSVTGHPAISICCDFEAQGMPLAMHLIGRRSDEATLLRVAAAYQRETEWHLRRPKLENTA